MGRLSKSLDSIFSIDSVENADEKLRRLRAWARSAIGDAPTSRLDAWLREHPRIYEDVCELLEDFEEGIRAINGNDKDGKELHQSLEDILEDLHDLLAHITLRNDRQTFDNVGWRQEVSKYLLIIDTRHVGDKFPNASADIVDRLGAANRDRRAKISFLKARREALGTQDEGKRIGLGKSADFSLFHDSAIGLSIESRIHGAGSASRLLRPGDSEADYAEESDNGSENTLTSYTATVPESAENPGTLTVPPLPHEIYQNKPFNCPTCGKILRSLSDYGAWKRHVFRDLQPYVCSYPYCPQPKRTYRRRRDWEAHEISLHLSEWICPVCDNSQHFWNRKALEEHLLRGHGDVVSASQIPLLIPGCRQNPHPEVGKYVCPLCQSTLDSPKKLLKHLALELEQLALFSLPRTLECDEAEGTSSVSFATVATRHYVALENDYPKNASLSSILSEEPLSVQEKFLPADFKSRKREPSELHSDSVQPTPEPELSGLRNQEETYGSPNSKPRSSQGDAVILQHLDPFRPDIAESEGLHPLHTESPDKSSIPEQQRYGSEDETPVLSRHVSSSPVAVQRQPQPATKHLLSKSEHAQLEAVFRRDESPSLADREELSQSMNISQEKVNVWFQNRRAKLKLENTERDENISANDDGTRYSRDFSFSIKSSDEEMHDKALAVYDFENENNNELPLKKGQIVWIFRRHSQGWLVAKDPLTHEDGLVPEGYIRFERDIPGGFGASSIQPVVINHSMTSSKDHLSYDKHTRTPTSTQTRNRPQVP